MPVRGTRPVSAVDESETCTCSDGCLCTECRVCRLQPSPRDEGMTLGQSFPRGLSDAEVRRRMREEAVEEELLDDELAEWRPDAPEEPNAWGVTPHGVDRDRVFHQVDVAYPDEGSITVELVPIEGRTRYRLTFEVLEEPLGEPLGDAGYSARATVPPETAWEE